MIISNLWAGYDSPILKGITWELTPGTVYGLLGENGSGKTTLGKVLQGQLPILHGSVQGLGAIPKGKPNPLVQIVPQHPANFPSLTVSDLVRLVCGGSLKVTQKLIDNYCLFCEPSTRLDELSMSGLALLYGLVAIEIQPRLIFFDETTATMAPDEVEVFIAFVKAYIQKGGIAVLVSHRLDEMSQYCDELIILRDGVLAERHKQGTSPQVLAKGMFLHLPNTLQQLNLQDSKKLNSSLDLKQFNQQPRWHANELRISSDQTHHWGVNNLTAQLDSGEILTVLGLKEQGIEVLEDSLVGLRSPDHGTRFPMAQLGSQEFGYIPRDRLTRGLFPSLTVGDNSAIHSGSNPNSKITLPIFSGNQPDPHLVLTTLSGGMAQRLMIERELNTGAKAFLLCEPGLGLDPSKKQELYDMILRLRNQGTGFLLLTSDVDEALILSDRIQVLYQGNLVQPDLDQSKEQTTPKMREILSDLMVGVDNHG